MHYILQCKKKSGTPIIRSHSVQGISKAKIKTVKLTVVVIVGYIVCSAPFICVQLWAALGSPPQDVCKHKITICTIRHPRIQAERLTIFSSGFHGHLVLFDDPQLGGQPLDLPDVQCQSGGVAQGHNLPLH